MSESQRLSRLNPPPYNVRFCANADRVLVKIFLNIVRSSVMRHSMPLPKQNKKRRKKLRQVVLTGHDKPASTCSYLAIHTMRAPVCGHNRGGSTIFDCPKNNGRLEKHQSSRRGGSGTFYFLTSSPQEQAAPLYSRRQS